MALDDNLTHRWYLSEAEVGSDGSWQVGGSLVLGTVAAADAGE